MSAYLENFTDKASIASAFAIDPLGDDVTIHIAYYGWGSYCGSAFVLFEKGGTFYEVNGSHCSCYGLEGQWEPEATTKAALTARFANNDFYLESGTDAFRMAMLAWLGVTE